MLVKSLSLLRRDALTLIQTNKALEIFATRTSPSLSTFLAFDVLSLSCKSMDFVIAINTPEELQ